MEPNKEEIVKPEVNSSHPSWIIMMVIFISCGHLVNQKRLGLCVKSLKNESNENQIIVIFLSVISPDLVNIIPLPFSWIYGAMNVFEHKVDEQIKMSKKHIVIRMRYVPFIDTTGIERLKSFILLRKKMGQKVYLTSVQPSVMAVIDSDNDLTGMIREKDVLVFSRTQEALGFLKSIGKGGNWTFILLFWDSFSLRSELKLT